MLKRKKKKLKKSNKKRNKQTKSNYASLLGLMAVVMLLIAILNQLIQSNRIDGLLDDQKLVSEKIEILDNDINGIERRFGKLFEENKEIIANGFFGDNKWKLITPKTVSRKKN